MLLARLKPSPTLTSQASSSALHKLSKVLPFIHVSDEGPHLPAEVIRAAKVCTSLGLHPFCACCPSFCFAVCPYSRWWQSWFLSCPFAPSE